MKRTIDGRSGGATAGIEPVAGQGPCGYAALLPSMLRALRTFVRMVIATSVAYPSRPVCASTAAADIAGLRADRNLSPNAGGAAAGADPADVHRARACGRRRTAAQGAAPEPKIKRERESGMDRYGQWSDDGSRPRRSSLRSRPPATDHGPDRLDPLTAALAS